MGNVTAEDWEQWFRIGMSIVGVATMVLGGYALKWIWRRRKVHVWAWVPILDTLAFEALAGLMLFVNVASFLLAYDSPEDSLTWAYRLMTFLVYAKLAATYVVMRKGLGVRAKLEYTDDEHQLRP